MRLGFDEPLPIQVVADVANCAMIAEKLRLDVCWFRDRDPRCRFDVGGLPPLYRPSKNTSVRGMNRMRPHLA